LTGPPPLKGYMVQDTQLRSFPIRTGNRPAELPQAGQAPAQIPRSGD
jgi:hypothetical protein